MIRAFVPRKLSARSGLLDDEVEFGWLLRSCKWAGVGKNWGKVSRITQDLDRGIYHQNFNIPKRDLLLKEHGEDLFQEKWLDREQWFVLKAKRPGVSARELARQYGLEELRDYISRSNREIDQMRGWPAGRCRGNRERCR